eukprot:c23380_g1_i1 orf=405-1151(+)
MSRVLCRATVCNSFFLGHLRGVSASPRLFPGSNFHEIIADGCNALLLSWRISFGSFVFVPRSWAHSSSSQKRKPKNLEEIPCDVSEDIDASKHGDPSSSDSNATEFRSRPSAKVVRIVDEIANLTLLEASDLSRLLKKKLGIPDVTIPYYGVGMMPGAAMPQLRAGASLVAEEKMPEKSSFDIKLENYDIGSKVKVIKEVRVLTSLGLKKAKELVENPPAILKKGVNKKEAEQIIEKMKAAQATVVME